MLKLVIDTALGYMGIGVAKDAYMLSSVVIEKPSTVTSLAVKTIDTMLKSTGYKKDELDEIIVSAGPGTFTSLRTGLSLAKGIGMALDIPIIPVSTLDAMAQTVKDSDSVIVAAIDGKNSNIYLAEYRFNEGKLEKTMPERVLKIGVNAYARQYHVHIVGWGIERYEDALSKIYTEGISRYKLDIMQMNASLALISHERLYNTGPVSASTFVPLYLREPDAKIRNRKEIIYEKDKTI
jgi:tRNA threonylcarbamoyladenosine biosynthesis protein TsaB